MKLRAQQEANLIEVSTDQMLVVASWFDSHFGSVNTHIVLLILEVDGVSIQFTATPFTICKEPCKEPIHHQEPTFSVFCFLDKFA